MFCFLVLRKIGLPRLCKYFVICLGLMYAINLLLIFLYFFNPKLKQCVSVHSLHHFCDIFEALKRRKNRRIRFDKFSKFC